MADYNRARSKGDLAAGKITKLKNSKRPAPRPGQQSHPGQNAFSSSNSGQHRVTATRVVGPAIQYDTVAAEAQWTKLHQAQEPRRRQSAPIRVSLPTRGLRTCLYAGAADQRGKPLTIRLMASNGPLISWPKRIAGPVAGFLVSLGHRRAHHKSNNPKISPNQNPEMMSVNTIAIRAFDISDLPLMASPDAPSPWGRGPG